MRYYYDIEQEKYISREQLKNTFEQLKTENPDEYNYSFPHFVMNCLTSNNGSLQTLSQRKTALEKAFFFATMDEFELGTDDTSESEGVKKEIDYINKLITEE